MMENHELKILNMFIKYMAYYSDTELTAFTDWIENNTKFELYPRFKNTPYRNMFEGSMDAPTTS